MGSMKFLAYSKERHMFVFSPTSTYLKAPLSKSWHTACSERGGCLRTPADSKSDLHDIVIRSTSIITRNQFWTKYMSDLFFKAQMSPECSIVCLIYVERRRYSSRWWSQSPSPGWHRSIDEQQTHQSTHTGSCSRLHLLWPHWSLPISQPEHRTEM